MLTYIADNDAELEIVVPEKISRKIKAYDENLMLVEVYFRNGAIGDEHVHEHEQISYCVDGEFNYSIEDKVYRMVKGDSIFVAKNLLHGCVLLSESGTLLDIFTPYRKDFV